MVVIEKVNNLPNFDFKGINSLAQKVYMTTKPDIPSPDMRMESIVVKGRDSSYTVTDGTYEDITISFGLRTYRGVETYQDSLNRLNTWLRTEWNPELNEITFSEYPQWIFKVKKIHPYTWEHFPSTGELTTKITMTCDPFKYSDIRTVVAGVTSTPEPMPPLEFKFSNSNGETKSRNDSVQDISDLAKFGYTRVLDDPSVNGNDLNDIDGKLTYAHQRKYTSGTYRNMIDDFYSDKFSAVVEGIASSTTVYTTSSTHMKINQFPGGNKVHLYWTTFPLTAGRSYFFDIMSNQGQPDMVMTIKDPSDKVVVNITNKSSVIFDAKTAGAYFIEIIIPGKIDNFIIEDPRLHLYTSTGGSKRTPARKSMSACQVFAFDVKKLVAKIEPNLLTDSMTESQLKATLKTRKLVGTLHAWCMHTSKTSVKLHHFTGTGYTEISSGAVDNTHVNNVFNTEIDSTSFVDRLFYRKKNNINELWAIFLIQSTGDFDDPNMSLSPFFLSTEKVSLRLGMDIQPQASITINNEGTAKSFPYLKIRKQPTATTCKVTFTGRDVQGRPYKRYIEIRNLENVFATQQIEVDCDFKDIIRFDRANPVYPLPWNMWSTTDGFPVMNPGSNTITVENADRVEITWRTRRI